MTGELVHYDAMVHAIAVAFEIDEVKDIRDKALALEMYSRQARNIDNERLATEIRIRAERKAGLLLKEREKPKGGGDVRLPKEHRSHDATGERTLTELGITKTQSSRWQQLADIPPGEFEEALHNDAMPTTNGILASARPAKPKGPEWMQGDVLWLWGQLREFELRDIFDTNPKHLYAKMHAGMQRDVRRLAPVVCTWLSQLEEIPP